jgi:YjbR
MTMREHDFRRMALAMDGAVEGAHMDHPDFRVNNRIFVTLHHDRKSGGLMLTPEQQAEFIRADAESFAPANGAWGRAGATTVHLASVSEEALGEAMTMAWKNCVDKGPSKPRRKGAVGPARRSKTR